MSRRILLKQSGILARIDGVVSGSNTIDRVLSPEARTSVQDSVAIDSLRGHIMHYEFCSYYFIGLISQTGRDHTARNGRVDTES
jgi:hypothetical protein